MKSIKESIFDDDSILRNADDSILRNAISKWLGDDYKTLESKYGINIEDNDTISILNADEPNNLIFKKSPEIKININKCKKLYIPIPPYYYIPNINHVESLDCSSCDSDDIIRLKISSVNEMCICRNRANIKDLSEFLKNTELNTLIFLESMGFGFGYKTNIDFESLVNIKKVNNIIICNNMSRIPFKGDKPVIKEIYYLHKQMKNMYDKFFDNSNANLYTFNGNKDIGKTKIYQIIRDSSESLGIKLKLSRINTNL